MQNQSLKCANSDIVYDNLMNTIAADALAACVTRPSLTMELTWQDEQVLSFHE